MNRAPTRTHRDNVGANLVFALLTLSLLLPPSSVCGPQTRPYGRSASWNCRWDTQRVWYSAQSWRCAL